MCKLVMKARIVKQSFDRSSDQYVVQLKFIFWWFIVGEFSSLEGATITYNKITSKKTNQEIIKTTK